MFDVLARMISRHPWRVAVSGPRRRHLRRFRRSRGVLLQGRFNDPSSQSTSAANCLEAATDPARGGVASS
jgi:hypothetical protein